MKQLITGIMVFFLCGLSVMAQETSDFNPTNPPEPNAAFELTLTSDSADAGSATGGGRYYVGDQVLLTATPTDYHVFVAWVDTSAADSVVSTQPSFYYTIPDRPVHLIARFEYRLMFQLTLELEPANIGAVYGSGYYESQSLAGISVSFSGQYTFKGWWDNDSLVSNQFYFQFQMPERSVHLKALFDYDPTNPSEPDVQASKHRLFLISDPPEACNFNQQQGVMIPENDSIYLYPYQNSGYVFEGWYHKGALYTTAYDIFFTMGVADDTLTARFRYDPASPGEPGKGSAPIYFLSATTQTTTAGSQLAFPVYLCNENLDVTSVVFEVTFPSGVLADYANASLSSRSNGHVLTCDTLGNNSFRFTIANDSLWALTSTSGKLMMIPVTLPSDWEAGSNYPVIFGAAVLGTTSGQLVCPVRNGSVGITPVAS
ncbi:MAG: InlB B-repeat-containing protein, partial [Bacteroidota bacterium]|nr:InlB B-repeat-containing protein [Bacteroidota bacterium]